MSYIGNVPLPQSTEQRTEWTVGSGGQSTFSTSGYATNGTTQTSFIDCWLNGVKLSFSDYTATNGTDVVLGTAAVEGDVFAVVIRTQATTAVNFIRLLAPNGTVYEVTVDNAGTLLTSSV